MSERDVSVCITLFNPNLRYLSEQALSLAQNAGAIREVILADDTPELDLHASVTETYRRALRSTPIRYIRRDRPPGMVANWNAACASAVGQMILNLGQDDLLAASALLRAHKALDAVPGAVFVGWGRRRIDDDGRPRRQVVHVNDRSYLYRPERTFKLTYDSAVYLVLANGQALAEPSCVLMRGDVWGAVGGYDHVLQHAADVDVLLRMLRKGPGVYLSNPLTLRREHAGNLTHLHVASRIASHDRRLLHARYSQTVTVGRRDRARWDAYLATHELFDSVRFLRRGQIRRARLATVDGFSALRRCGVGAVLDQLNDERRGTNRDRERTEQLMMQSPA